MIEPILLVANYENFIVHFENKGTPDHNMRWGGSVAQIQLFDNGDWEYQANDSSDCAKELKDARIWFEWSFCWRGVWEGRIYFKDEEYWCEELKTLPEIWSQIEAILKDRIKADNPEYKHFD